MLGGQAWHAVPGVLELLEAGDESRVLQALSAPTQSRSVTDAGGAKLRYLVKFLQGYRRAGLLCERLLVGVPLFDLWPVPGGSARLTHSAKLNRSSGMVLKIAGSELGSGTETVLSEPLTFSAHGTGRRLLVSARLTIYEYIHRETGESIHRVDIDNGEHPVEFEIRELGATDFPLPQRTVAQSTFDTGGWVVTRIIRNGGSSADDPDNYRLNLETTQSWSASIGLPSALALGNALKLSLAAERTEALEVEFELPRNQSSIFFHPSERVGLVPFSAALLL
jgi:hypothetical protein